MRNGTIGIVAAFIVGVGLAFGGQFTDTDKAANHGKTGLDNLTAEIDANFAIIEGVLPSATVISNKYLKVWNANGGTTTSNLTAAGSVTITEGALANSTVVGADIKDGEVASADIANGTILGADIRTNTVGKANLAAADFGDFTVGADGTCELDSGAVGTAEIATDGVGADEIAAGAVGTSEIANGSILGADIRTNTVGKANLAAADFGDFTVGADGTCTLDAGAVALTALAGGLVKNGTASTTDLRIRYGTATNGQAVTWGETFTAVVFADIVDTNGTNAYFSAITTSGGTASVAKPHTNRWFVIGL
jgi:hypothetical protein